MSRHSLGLSTRWATSKHLIESRCAPYGHLCLKEVVSDHHPLTIKPWEHRHKAENNPE